METNKIANATRSARILKRPPNLDLSTGPKKKQKRGKVLKTAAKTMAQISQQDLENMRAQLQHQQQEIERARVALEASQQQERERERELQQARDQLLVLQRERDEAQRGLNVELQQ